jgi:hypothetical protein
MKRSRLPSTASEHDTITFKPAPKTEVMRVKGSQHHSSLGQPVLDRMPIKPTKGNQEQKINFLSLTGAAA